MGQLVWIWWFWGGLLGLVGVWLLRWSLFGDRARGRRRCPKCWYDMSGVPGLRCPECGRDAKRERRLSKSRPRWRFVVAAAILLASSIASFCYPQYRRFGALSLIPTDILLWFNPAPGHEYDWDPAAGDTVLHPVSAELSRRIESGGLAQRHWSRLMQDERLFVVRPAWPLDEPMTIGVSLPAWIGTEVDSGLMGVYPGELRMRVMIDGWEGDAVDLAVNNESLGPGAFRIIEFPQWFLDGERVSLSAALYVRAFDEVLDEQTRLPVWRGRLPESVRLVQSTQDAILPSDDNDLMRQVADKMHIQLDYREFTDQRTRASLWISLDGTITPQLSELAIGVHVEIQRDYETLAEFSDALLPWDLDLRGTTDRRLYVELPSVAEELARDHSPKQIQRWTVRITGDGSAALRDVNKPRYWTGELERPLSDVLHTKE